uniref:non-specific serine/threonine protein kinase n=1 Tax=Cucumis melo TaxID=3656 RepID=A0A9I9EJW3_CUCME
MVYNSGILLHEMLYGYTPFKGKTRQKTFANILHKDLKFPRSISVLEKELVKSNDILSSEALIGRSSVARKLIIGLHQVNTSNVIILEGVQVYVHNFMEGERMIRIFNYTTQKHKSVIFQGVDDNNRETLSLELSKSVELGGG